MNAELMMAMRNSRRVRRSGWKRPVPLPVRAKQ